MSDRKAPPRPAGKKTNSARQQMIDRLIDEMGVQSFPASDPPTWGTVSSRVDQARRDAGKS
jgi:hypothetical protein